MPRRRPADDLLPDPRPSLIDGQQGRFTARPNQAGFHRWYAGNYHAGAA